MKIRYLLLLAVPLVAFGQDGPPPPIMPSNLFFDENFIVTAPQNKLTVSTRFITGAKSSFDGAGVLDSTLIDGGDFDAGDFTAVNVPRGYHDGSVNKDARTRAIDDGSGNLVLVPISPDGKTNNWSMTDQSQVTSDGNVEMNTYKAAIIDDGPKQKNPRNSYGVELVLRHDMFQTPKMNVTFLGAISLNGLTSMLRTAQDAEISRLTDTFSLDGVPAPTAPYPSSATGISVPVVDVNGFPIIGSEGDAASSAVDLIVPLVQQPTDRVTNTETVSGAVTNRYDLRGAYFTVRAGPNLELPIGNRFQANFSAGAALVYSGTTYSVQQDFQPDTGAVITDTVTSTKNTLLPGFYADASMQFNLTERAGFYFGAVYQNSGNYKQSVSSDAASYSTSVNLQSLQGFHGGLNVRF